MSVDALGYGEVIAAVRAHIGLTLSLWDSGGGMLILTACLETGHDVWVTDAQTDVMSLRERREREAAGESIGYLITVRCDDDDESAITLASVDHVTATAEQLPELIGLAIASLPTNAHHVFREPGHPRGEHVVTHEIQRW